METAMKIRYPSEDFPAFPNVELEIPDGWATKIVPEVDLCVIQDRGSADFSPNLVGVFVRDVAGHTLEEAGTAPINYVKGIEGAKVLTSVKVPINDRSWTVLEYGFTDQQVGTMFQIIATTVHATERVTDTLRLTGTCRVVSFEQMNQDVATLREIIDSAILS
jgi:hypothetical protein